MQINYSKICKDLLAGLSKRQKEIIIRRFGLKTNKKETLEAIGKSLGITKERVRQIEKISFTKIKEKIKQYQKVFQYFIKELKKTGGFRKEDILISKLSDKKYHPYILFFLTIGEMFHKAPETNEHYCFWYVAPLDLDSIKNQINLLSNKIKEFNKLISLKELSSLSNIKENILSSYLEISKMIQNNKDGFWGLKTWPEINPKGVKDKAFLVFKQKQQPLHFREVARFINPPAFPQTVHNELIKDPRFVLVGRGTYALKEWGYKGGNVKDVILDVLKQSQSPLPKNIILQEVLKYKLVKPNTILLNLNNKKYFSKDSQGNYTIREA